MYSVIIQNSLTTESFLEHYPFFLEAVKREEVGICKWNESGTTIDTALPELRELTDDKEAWRAIVVRLEGEDEVSAFRADNRNPYDFKDTDSWDELVTESKNPLIRLTHMLGGVTAPEKSFEKIVIEEEFKAPRIVYEPVVNEAREKSYQRLKRKYEYDGKRPVSIVMVTARGTHRFEDSIEGAWENHKESYSSEFWKRNHYPSICRFLVYDFGKDGPIQKISDEFGFWASVMMLAYNQIDSATLQAYRLYRLKTSFDKEAMQDAFQVRVDKLRTAKQIIKKSLRHAVTRDALSEEYLPDYEMEIPVDVEFPRFNDAKVQVNKFGVLSNSIKDDIAQWNSKRRKAERAVEKSVEEAERTLDQTAGRTKDLCFMDEDIVLGLNKYQREDMNRELEELYDDIISLQMSFPNVNMIKDDNTEKASEKVVDYLKGRITKSTGRKITIGAIALIVFSQLPALFTLIKQGDGSIPGILTNTVVCIVSVVFAVVYVLLAQHNEFKQVVSEYNTIVMGAFSRLRESTENYSRYLSAITSHSRGCSYLDIATKKDRIESDFKKTKYKHLKAIELLLGRLQAWAKAYHLRLDFNAALYEDDYKMDMHVAPMENPLYTFEVGKRYEAGLNRTGYTVVTPFDFVKKVEIIREELYDDDL